MNNLGYISQKTQSRYNNNVNPYQSIQLRYNQYQILSHYHFLQMALVQVDAFGEQDVCGGLDDNDHQPAPSHVQLVKDEFSVLGMPNS